MRPRPRIRYMAINCDTCGNPVTSTRPDVKYCSGRCRTVAYRKRHEPDRAPVKRRPLSEAYGETVYDLGRRVDRLGRLTDDDRFRRNRDLLSQRTLPNLLRARAALDRIILELDPSQADGLVTDHE